jgi:hypothetical protein
MKTSIDRQASWQSKNVSDMRQEILWITVTNDAYLRWGMPLGESPRQDAKESCIGRCDSITDNPYSVGYR